MVTFWGLKVGKWVIKTPGSGHFSVVGKVTFANPTSDLIQQRLRAVYMTFDHLITLVVDSSAILRPLLPLTDPQNLISGIAVNVSGFSSWQGNAPPTLTYGMLMGCVIKITPGIEFWSTLDQVLHLLQPSQ